MTTDPPLAGCPPADDTADLLALVHGRTRDVIDSELQRLARRAPSLDASDLGVVNEALEALAESLILGRLLGPPTIQS
jgi:hypothetical protein